MFFGPFCKSFPVCWNDLGFPRFLEATMNPLEPQPWTAENLHLSSKPAAGKLRWKGEMEKPEPPDRFAGEKVGVAVGSRQKLSPSLKTRIIPAPKQVCYVWVDDFFLFPRWDMFPFLPSVSGELFHPFLGGQKKGWSWIWLSGWICSTGRLCLK